MNNIFKYIVGKYFFKDYAPNVADWKKKMSGKNGRGNPIDFKENDKKEIKAALKKLFKDLTG